MQRDSQKSSYDCCQAAHQTAKIVTGQKHTVTETKVELKGTSTLAKVCYAESAGSFQPRLIDGGNILSRCLCVLAATIALMMTN